MAKKSEAPAKSPTKSEIYAKISEATELSKKQVQAVIDSLTDVIAETMGKKGSGLFALPGVLKIKRVNKPATKGGTRTNPFTGQPMEVKPKPARSVVKVLALKKLKEMV
jgi:nucleoid DNA-binding protein